MTEHEEQSALYIDTTLHIDELDWEIKEPKCQGGCERHVGGASLVKVYDPESKTDFGFFYYCANACLEDQRNKLTVIGYGLEEPESELKTHNLKQRIDALLESARSQAFSL